MKLYLVHCGFYDSNIGSGIFENHTDFFVVGKDFDEARARVKIEPGYQEMKMHVDGVIEIRAVQGYTLNLTENSALNGQSDLVNFRYRDLATKPVTATVTEPVTT